MNNSSQQSLKLAVQEQLDLILKIEEDRKILKKQNKILAEKHRQMLVMVKKYQTQKNDIAVGDEEPFQAHVFDVQKKISICVQSESQTDHQLDQNTSKLEEAQNLLKMFDQSKYITESLCSKCQQRQNNTILTNSEVRKKVNQNPIKNSNVSDEILKMAKQITHLKKDLKDSEKKFVMRDKQIKELKKCLEMKSEALQKSRKEFNELSKIFNTDKYKSVKSLEQELRQNKQKLIFLEQKATVGEECKRMLEDVTQEYANYKEQMEQKVRKLWKNSLQADINDKMD